MNLHREDNQFLAIAAVVVSLLIISISIVLIGSHA